MYNNDGLSNKFQKLYIYFIEILIKNIRINIFNQLEALIIKLYMFFKKLKIQIINYIIRQHIFKIIPIKELNIKN